jgi:hypothetical protein
MRGSSRIGMLLLALAFAPAVARGQQTRNFRVGLYFDADAQSCVTSLANFDSVRVWAFAYVDPGTQVNGAILRLELPPAFQALTRTVRPPKAAQFSNLSGDLTGAKGLDMTWQKCVASDGLTPIQLFSFRLDYFDIFCPSECQVPDVVLQFAGGTGAADSLASIMPRVKLCPDDPVGGHGELIESPSLRATLNCTTDCPCTLGVQAKTWAEVKQLYREP